MKNNFKPGDMKIHRMTVSKNDTAVFDTGEVHPVCSTFALTREAEWAARLFVLEMKDEDEEGIGTMVQVNHISPALVGEELEITARVVSTEDNELVCSFTAKVGTRLVAEGKTGQKILKKEKINDLFARLK